MFALFVNLTHFTWYTYIYICVYIFICRPMCRLPSRFLRPWALLHRLNESENLWLIVTLVRSRLRTNRLFFSQSPSQSINLIRPVALEMLRPSHEAHAWDCPNMQMLTHHFETLIQIRGPFSIILLPNTALPENFRLDKSDIYGLEILKASKGSLF